MIFVAHIQQAKVKMRYVDKPFLVVLNQKWPQEATTGLPNCSLRAPTPTAACVKP